MTPFRWALLGSLYITQFLALGFFLIALVAIMRREGAPLEQLGIIYLLGLIWVAKALWAPLVDRIRFGVLGHYRGWLILTQTGMVICLLVTRQFDAMADFQTVFLLSLVIALLSATQDVAADGLACRLLSPANRSVGSGVQMAGGLAGNIIGGGGVLMLYPTVGWEGSMVLLAAGVALPLALILWFREPTESAAGGDQPEERRGSVSFSQIWRFWQRPGNGRWLAILLTYPVAVSMSYALITPILVDADWSLERIGFVLNIVGSAVGMLAALAAGWAIRWIGRRTALVGAALAQAVGLLILLLPASGFTDTVSVTVSLSAVFLLYGAAAPIVMTLMMDQASPASAGTDFTIQYSVYSLVGFAAGAIGLPLAGLFGYQGVVVLSASIGLVAAMVARGFYQEAALSAPVEEPVPVEPG